MHIALTRQWSVTRLTCALAVTAFVCVSGCGQTATVLTGVVTLDGKPIEKAFVNFTPERRDAPSATAVTDLNGRYSVRLEAVPFRVTIVAQRVVRQVKNDTIPNGPLVDVYEDIVPKQYSDVAKTSLTARPITNAVTTVDFPLTADSSK